MALSIKDPETDRLVRHYANKHATSFTGAIRLAVTNALRHEGESIGDPDREARNHAFRKMIAEIQHEVAKLPVLDPRHPDDILYDADGLPKATDDWPAR